jgi:hypothetical protein
MLSLRLGGKGFIDGIQPALSAIDLYFMVFILTNLLVTMHQIVRGANKLQRSLLLFVLVPDSTTYSQVTSRWESFDNGSLLQTPR